MPLSGGGARCAVRMRYHKRHFLRSRFLIPAPVERWIGSSSPAVALLCRMAMVSGVATAALVLMARKHNTLPGSSLASDRIS